MERLAAAGGFLLLVAAVGWFVWHNATAPNAPFPFRLGLDLAGGVELTYDADTAGIPPAEEREALRALRDVLERRVNLFGVAEPRVRIERTSVVAGGTSAWRVRVELPGVTDIEGAVRTIGATPLLEFKLEAMATSSATSSSVQYLPTGITGRFLKRAQVVFAGANGGPAQPVIELTFDEEGARRFYELTRDHVGERLAVFLDGRLVTQPVIREPIPGGKAQISGSFTIAEAREIARNLNLGALPVPITLAGVQQVGPTYGKELLAAGVRAALVALGALVLFMVVWYRVPGIVAAVTLVAYVVVMLALFQFIPVVITAAGIAGLVLSMGMAVDANVLVFERLREELAEGAPLEEAVERAFSRAWRAVRDGNLTSLLTAGVLYWLGTSFVEGFALVLGLGIVVSLFVMMAGARWLLRALVPALSRLPRWVWHGL